MYNLYKLPLSLLSSVLGRSIGLHLPPSGGGALFSCAEVQRVYISRLTTTIQVLDGQSFTRYIVMRVKLGASIFSKSSLYTLLPIFVALFSSS